MQGFDDAALFGRSTRSVVTDVDVVRARRLLLRAGPVLMTIWEVGHIVTLALVVIIAPLASRLHPSQLLHMCFALLLMCIYMLFCKPCSVHAALTPWPELFEHLHHGPTGGLVGRGPGESGPDREYFVDRGRAE